MSQEWLPSRVNSRFFSAIPLSRFSLKMSRFLFAYFELGKMRSAQRQVELRRLGNQLPVLGKANSLCEVDNIILTTRDITVTCFV